MGFPDTFRIPVSDTQAYRQFGNSVVMPVMREVARIMLPYVAAGAGAVAAQPARVKATRITPHAHAGLSDALPTGVPGKTRTKARAKAGTGTSLEARPETRPETRPKTRPETHPETPAHASASTLTVTIPPAQAA
jgi:DNA (cytosine-5)-methyltransferase 1